MCDVMCQWLEISDVRVNTTSGGSSSVTGLGIATTASAVSQAAAGAAVNGDVPDEFMLLQVSGLGLVTVTRHTQHGGCAVDSTTPVVH